MCVCVCVSLLRDCRVNAKKMWENGFFFFFFFCTHFIPIRSGERESKMGRTMMAAVCVQYISVPCCHHVLSPSPPPLFFSLLFLLSLLPLPRVLFGSNDNAFGCLACISSSLSRTVPKKPRNANCIFSSFKNVCKPPCLPDCFAL